MGRFKEHQEVKEHNERSVNEVLLVILGKQLKRRLDQYAKTHDRKVSAAAADLIKRGLDAVDAEGTNGPKPASPSPVRKIRKR
jgi:hypothetical protein